jgi:hypothetical protein
LGRPFFTPPFYPLKPPPATPPPPPPPPSHTPQRNPLLAHLVAFRMNVIHLVHEMFAQQFYIRLMQTTVLKANSLRILEFRHFEDWFCIRKRVWSNGSKAVAANTRHFEDLSDLGKPDLRTVDCI